MLASAHRRPWRALEEFARAHGRDPITCATLQPGLRYVETSFGYLAYARARGSDITLGPPVCAPSDRPDLLRRFLSSARRPILCYLDDATLRDLEDLGANMHAASMGVDRMVDVVRLTCEPPRAVRSAVRQAERAGFELVPLSTPVSEPLRARIAEITSDYLERSQVPVEMGFLNGRVDLDGDGPQRIDLLTGPGPERPRVFGYVVSNPWFESGIVRGHLIDAVRFERVKPWGLYLWVVGSLARRARREGHRLSLGFSPLAGLGPAPALRSRTLETQMKWIGHAFSEVLYVKHLREMKQRIPGHEQRRYFASHSRSAITALAKFLEVMGVPRRQLLGLDTLRAISRSRDDGGGRDG